MFPSWPDLAPALRGQLADQLAGQQLRPVSYRLLSLPPPLLWALAEAVAAVTASRRSR